MPGKCCAMGCKSGYPSRKEKTHLFSFPKDEKLKMKWLKAIGRQDYKPGRCTGQIANGYRANYCLNKMGHLLNLNFQSVVGFKGLILKVCHKHFQESDIIKHCSVNNTGETLLLSKVMLKKGAIPCIDLNNPYTEKCHESAGSQELSEPKTSPREYPSPKTVPKSEPENSSDDDVPLEKLRNRCLSTSFKNVGDFLDKSVVEDPDTEDSDRTLRKKFEKLLEDYEQLKDRSVGLNQEIRLLERVNVELKCKIFKG